ncbi:MAG TPA: hypothetical protein P5110_06385 [Candidatus Omnitrophota bacterium]|nr:hypothetical protein [Candidatus Omnitrophota bacterium]HRZ15121.1 hypothetical protein [Candidatus Omnitrophota bacterium]
MQIPASLKFSIGESIHDALSSFPLKEHTAVMDFFILNDSRFSFCTIG